MQLEDGLAWSAQPTGSFVGRAAPLALLQRCLDEALGGCPRAVLVEGVAGIGKSTLVAEMLGSARRRGALVLVGRCSEDLSVPYLPLASALEPLGDELGAAVQLLDPAAVTDADPLAAPDLRPAAPLVAACRAAVRVARRRPAVLLLEDLHWSDRCTADLFERLVASLLDAGATASTAMLVVTTMRPPSDHVARIVERLRRESAVRSILLAGMNEFEINQLLTNLGPARPSRLLLSCVAEATGGNPLMVRALLGRLTETGGVEVRGGELTTPVGELLALPGGLDGELRRRLDRVSRPCRTLLTSAAFLGDGALLTDLELVAPPADAEFDDLWGDAESAGLVHDDGERYWFDHPQLRQLLYHGPGGRHRQRLHRHIADQLETRYGDDPRRSTEIADHLRRGGAGVDRSRLARCCLAAGESAYATGAWGAAARYFDDALDADPPDDKAERARLALRAGVGHFRDHDLPSAEQRLTEAIAGARTAGDVEVWSVGAQLLTRARLTIGPGSVGARIDTSILDELLAAVHDDPRRTGEIVGLLAEVRFAAFDVEGGLALVDEARELARRSGDDALATSVELAAGLQHLGRLRLDAADAAFRSSAEHARRLPDPWQRVWGLGRLPLVEIVRGDLDPAAGHAHEAAAIATANHDWAEHALASACSMQVAAAQCEFAAAEACGAAALQMYRRSDYSMVPPLVYPALAAVRSARGDLASAEEALDGWVADGGRSLAPYRLLVVAAAEDVDALKNARPFRPVGGRAVNLFSLPMLCAQVEVGAVLGDVALLADAYEPLAATHRAGVCWSVGWPLLLSRLLAAAARCLGRLDEAGTWCDVAAAEATEGRASGELARVTFERAQLAAACGDRPTAAELAVEAAAAFDQLGMLPLAQAAQRLGGTRASGEGVLRTILFTDLVGSTALNIRRGDVEYLELLSRHNSILRNALRRFDGVEIKHTGDGIGAWFSSATSACDCAIAARDDFAEHNASHPSTPLLVRFGLASGSPIPHEGDLFGVVMSLAARLCDQAAPGQVLVSEDVTTAATGTRLSFRPLDLLDLRGFPEPVAAFAVG